MTNTVSYKPIIPPDGRRVLMLRAARAFQEAGYAYTTRVANGEVVEHHWQLDTTHHVTFEPAPQTVPGQTRLTIRHGAQHVVWDGIAHLADAITALVTLEVLARCWRCDVMVPVGVMECQLCAATSDLIAYDAAVDAADHGRHAAHEAA